MVFNNNLLLGAAGQGDGGYTIDQSIRFNDDDSAYLTRTPSSAGDKRTWTFSVWAKRGNLGADRRIFTAASNGTEFFFDANDKLNFYHYSGGFVWQYISNALFRDPAAWYHFVLRVDTTDATAQNRIRVYANGEQITDWGTSTAPSQNAEGFVNGTSAHYIGRYSGSDNNHWDGYLAEINHVDGSSLAPTEFGETNADTGEWVPIEYTGSYGTNGFYITGQDSTFLGQDVRTSGDQVNSFQSSQYTGATSDYTFSDGRVEADTSNRAIRTVDTFTGDFEFTWRYVNMANFIIGLYEIDEDATFNSSSSAGNMQNMTDSWYVQTSSVASNRDIKYGSTTVVESTTIANGDVWKMTRESGTIKVYRNDSLVHTFTQTSTNEVRLVIAQGDAAADANQISWVDNSTLGNNFFSSGLAAADQVTDSPTNNQATLNPLFSGVTLSDGNLVATASGNSYQRAFSTFAIDDGGKYVCEFQKSSGTFGLIGIMQNGNHTNKTGNSNMFGINLGNGEVFKANPTASILTTVTAPGNSLMRIEYDSSADTITIFDDGTEIFPAATGVSDTVGLTGHDSLHFGCAPYGSGTVITATFSPLSGTPTTDFKELTTANLDDPTIALPEKYFNTVLYEGNGGGQRVGQFQPITETYTVPNSVIFNDNDSAYLTRTPSSAGDRKTWTFSSWVKRANFFNGSAPQIIFSAANGSTLDFIMQFGQSDDTLRISDYSSGTASNLITTRLFRDSSAWYHFVLQYDTTQATSSDRMKLYVNGTQVTAFGTEIYPSLNYDSAVNNNIAHNISRGAYSANGYFDGYQAEINFIDGSSLGPDSFGQLDASTNRWIPKDASGLSFGTNGFYLDMETAPGTGSGAGTDSSGNGNNFTETGFAAADQVEDSPTENFSTWNPLKTNASATLSNGNLNYTASGAYRTTSTLPVNSGKWYAEFTISAATGSQTWGVVDVDQVSLSDAYIGQRSYEWGIDGLARTWNNGSNAADYTDFTAGDVIGIALDMDNGKVWFRDNDGTFLSGGDPVAGTTPDFSGLLGNICFAAQFTGGNVTINCGQSAYTNTPPTGFNALNTDNLPLSNGDLSAFVWIKNRDATDNHMLFDAVRGATKDVHSNSTAAEVTNANTLTRFLKNGFEVSNDAEVNTSGESYVAWQWLNDSLSTSANTDGSISSTVLANTTSGFSIVSYTGTGTAATVGHGLGVAPSMIIAKNRSTTSNWSGYHVAIGATKTINLNETAAAQTSSGNWNNTEPTSSVFSVNTATGTNGSGNSIVAYCFAEVEGFSKFGSYTGNGSTDGPFIYTGFKPRFVMIKRYTSTESWPILDTARGSGNFGSDAGSGGDNPTAGNDLNAVLVASTTAAEEDNAAGSRRASYVSNGFKVRTTNTAMNGSGSGYIYMAFAESPFKTATAR